MFNDTRSQANINLHVVRQHLWDTLAPEIQIGLHDDSIDEIMLNPDGGLWFSHQQKGHVPIAQLPLDASDAFVHALADYANVYLNEQTPYLDAILPIEPPFNGERVNVTVAPMVDGTAFNIRKKSRTVFTLNDYIEKGIMTAKQGDLLRQAMVDKKNILVSGSPASGKTTLTNALLHELASLVREGERVLILEQVPELQSVIPNSKVMLTTPKVSMQTLLWIAMRNTPDRIVVGEVRDGSALDLLKAWNTGCSGGIATIHSNSATAAMQRMLDLACEVVAQPPYALASEALDIVVQITSDPSHPAKRCVTGMIEVNGFDTNKQLVFTPYD